MGHGPGRAQEWTRPRMLVGLALVAGLLIWVHGGVSTGACGLRGQVGAGRGM